MLWVIVATGGCEESRFTGEESKVLSLLTVCHAVPLRLL